MVLGLASCCFLLGAVRHAAVAVAVTGPRDEREHAARRAEGASDALPALLATLIPAILRGQPQPTGRQPLPVDTVPSVHARRSGTWRRRVTCDAIMKL